MEFRADLDIQKTRMNGLSCGEESMTIYSAVLIGCQRVTDGQTDGRTDVKPIAITCFSIADARKNKAYHQLTMFTVTDYKLKKRTAIYCDRNGTASPICQLKKLTGIHLLR